MKSSRANQVEHPANTLFKSSVGVVAALFAAMGIASADNFTTATQQGTGNNWNNPIWNPGGVSPTAGNTYECIAGGNPTRVRNPASGSGDPVIGIKTFPGDSLTLDTGSEIRAKGVGNTIDFPGVGGNPGLIMNGGNIDTGDDGTFGLSGVVLIQANSRMSCGDGAQDPRGWIISAQIRGSAGWQLTKQVNNSTVVAADITSLNNPYSGTWTVLSGKLRGTGVGSLGSGNITISATNAAVIPQLEVMYDISSPGTLTLTSGGQMILHQACTFTDVIIEGTHLTPGLHTYAELSSTYPNNFPAGGSGSISVQPPAPPSVPTNITVINGDSQVSLSWSPAANAASYFVKRSEVNGGPYTVVGTPSSPSFVDGGLFNGLTYYYVISATNSLGESANSVQVTGKPNNAVTGLTATGGTGQVALAWNALIGATSYRVQRSNTSGGPYAPVASGITGTTYTDTTVQSGRTYFYTVIASLVGGSDSGISNEASGTVAPAAPANLAATLFAASVITLKWTEADPVISQFNVERSTDGVSFSPVGTATGTQRGYTNTALALGTTYFYRVQAQNAGGFSPYSLIASNTTPTFGINVDFGLSTAPVAPGYVNDSGSPYGDRGNGYSYGWYRNGAPVDLNADARYRQAANSPDIRYDTFVHLIKATPPAVWEIAIPNGFYFFHIVAGDPANLDSVFQFNVEGTLTGTVTPNTPGAFNVNWGDFTGTALVNDGLLTVASGPDSQTTANNNKIGFIDIYPAVAIPIVITTQPVSPPPLQENRPINLTVAVGPARPPTAIYEGYQPVFYQWYRDSGAGFNPVPNQTNATMSIPLAQLSDSGNYRAIITNYAGSVTSQVAAVNVTPDNDPPRMVSVGSADGKTVGICFDELIDSTDPNTTDSFNFTVHDSSGDAFPLTSGGVFLRPDGKSIQLVLDLSGRDPLAGNFTVTMGTVKDLKGNAGSAAQSGTPGGFTPAYVGYDVGGGPLNVPPYGPVFSCTNGEFDIIAGGTDIWGNADQGQLTLMPRSGDFEAVVKIQGITMADPISKAGLMVRQSFDSNSPALYISMNPPPPGRDQGEAGARTTVGGATAAWTANTNYLHIDGVPNAWQRLTRTGNNFKAYHGSNGVDWVLFAEMTQAFTDPVLVGMATTAHTTTTNLTTALYRNLKITSSNVTPTPPRITPSSIGLSGGVFHGSFQTQAGVNYTVQYVNRLRHSDNLSDPEAVWTNLTTIPGDGTVKTFTDPGPMPTYSSRFAQTRLYRIVAQ